MFGAVCWIGYQFIAAVENCNLWCTANIQRGMTCTNRQRQLGRANVCASSVLPREVEPALAYVAHGVWEVLKTRDGFTIDLRIFLDQDTICAGGNMRTR